MISEPSLTICGASATGYYLGHLLSRYGIPISHFSLSKPSKFTRVEISSDSLTNYYKPNINPLSSYTEFIFICTKTAKITSYLEAISLSKARDAIIVFFQNGINQYNFITSLPCKKHLIGNISIFSGQFDHSNSKLFLFNENLRMTLQPHPLLKKYLSNHLLVPPINDNFKLCYCSSQYKIIFTKLVRSGPHLIYSILHSQNIQYLQGMSIEHIIHSIYDEYYSLSTCYCRLGQDYYLSSRLILESLISNHIYHSALSDYTMSFVDSEYLNIVQNPLRLSYSSNLDMPNTKMVDQFLAHARL